MARIIKHKLTPALRKWLREVEKEELARQLEFYFMVELEDEASETVVVPLHWMALRYP